MSRQLMPTPNSSGLDVEGLQMRPVDQNEADKLATPAYLFDPAVAVRRYTALRDALGTRLVVSFKANSLVDLLVRCGHAFVDGVELASIGELGVVTGRIAQHRYVNNPAMDTDFMRAALISGCDFIIDSVEQARTLAAMDVGQRRPRALLRLNAGAISASAGTTMHDHFGMDVIQAREAASILSHSQITVVGVHSFGGANTFARDGQAHARNVRRAVDELQTSIPQMLAEINLGGGFATDWEKDLSCIAAYRRLVEDLFPDTCLLHEAGRGIFGRAGAFLTRVVAVKALGERRIAVCDGGMAQNFLLASTEGMLRRHGLPMLLRATPALPGPAPVDVHYVGSSCNRQDVIGRDQAAVAPPSVGDISVFPDCGAYNSTYTMRDFLMLPSARSYLRAAP
ncbi:hypothetical protein NYR97_11560 [Xanthomonas hydrangeae]|uniref:Orn/DAP/Arg decarboxylase 2 N-terminal domain-containing protein n=1 Tax=Xanthomonas hydrangeae TaxID=2775159 RepID=A0AAU0B7F1_9XANT|nr:hypothetical protein [Xanthomonas hydrangeae]WOB47930.1 hypothetical protein NYR97_11560 [Xanthomonas hydrangeae]